MTYLPTSILVSLALFFSVASSQNQENLKKVSVPTDSRITKISYNSAGGRAGNYESLTISSAAIVYVQGHSDSKKIIKEKTVKSFWNSLTKSLNIRDFDEIKSDPGHALYDGIDITITVVSGGKQHTIVNGNDDKEHYIGIKAFTDLLETKLENLRNKIK